MSFRVNYWKRGEIATTLTLIGVAVMAIGALVGARLSTSPQTLKSQAAGNCSYNSGETIALGSTESDASNMENRWPISQHPHEYDVFGPGYFNLRPNTDQDILTLTKQDGGSVDSKVNGFMGQMVGYKPSRLTAAYDMVYGSAPRGNDSEAKGIAPVLDIPTDAGSTLIRVPSTGYDIGGGYEAMVVFAASDRVTIHIGRHEYFVGSGNNCNGGPCSGGYWIYVKGICVDQKIQDAYNSVKGAQQSAGANKTPIQLPMVKPNQVLGKAISNSVVIGVRDNGPFITTSKPVYWDGVSVRDFQQTQPSPTSSASMQCTNEGGHCVTSPTDCQGTNQQLVSGKGCASYCCLPKNTQASTPTPTTGSIYSPQITPSKTPTLTPTPTPRRTRPTPTSSSIYESQIPTNTPIPTRTNFDPNQTYASYELNSCNRKYTTSELNGKIWQYTEYPDGRVEAILLGQVGKTHIVKPECSSTTSL